jgi:hypothetical protein
MRSPKRMKAKGIMHMAKLRKPSNEQAHATPKRSYLSWRLARFSGKLSTWTWLRSRISLVMLRCGAIEVVCGVGFILRGPSSLSIHMFTTVLTSALPPTAELYQTSSSNKLMLPWRLLQTLRTHQRGSCGQVSQRFVEVVEQGSKILDQRHEQQQETHAKR